MDTLITVLSLLGIGFGIASMLRRQHRLFRWVFYVSILGANLLRIARSLGRGEGAGASDTLIAAFLVTALLGEFIRARRAAK